MEQKIQNPKEIKQKIKNYEKEFNMIQKTLEKQILYAQKGKIIGELLMKKS